MSYSIIKIFSVVLIIALLSCKQDEVDGIIIGDILSTHQSYEKNQMLVSLIEQTLNKKPKALVDLLNFD